MKWPDDDDTWRCDPTDPPDFWRCFGSLPGGTSIWAPGWRDAYPPAPCLCSAWGGYSDESRLFPGIKKAE
jgi:hypothetical protein